MKNALVSLSNIVCDALKMGMSVDLAELGNLRVSVPSKMMDTAAEVTAKDALKTPKIVFTPKQKMRDAANKVELSIDKGTVTTSHPPAARPAAAAKAVMVLSAKPGIRNRVTGDILVPATFSSRPLSPQEKGGTLVFRPVWE